MVKVAAAPIVTVSSEVATAKVSRTSACCFAGPLNETERAIVFKPSSQDAGSCAMSSEAPALFTFLFTFAPYFCACALLGS